MGLRSVNIGYSEEAIDESAIQQIRLGNNLTRPSFVELEAAELVIETIKSVEMVKFTKNGSTAVTAAVKLARAYTNRTIVARCSQHPFFSYDDWFISSTPVDRGIPNETKEQIKTFDYNQIESLKKLIEDFPNQIACVVLEPANSECPGKSKSTAICEGRSACTNFAACNNNNFLKEVEYLCKQNGIVFILDEMISGFRWELGGAQSFYDVTPDLCTFGKAMANGFSVACVGGKREIMQLGSIESIGSERVFLLSTTHGAEMSSLGAFIGTLKFIKEHNVIDHLWNYGNELIRNINEISREFGIESHFKAFGFGCSPYYATLGPEGQVSLDFRTLFQQEMIKSGVLMPWISIAYRHNSLTMEQTYEALVKSLRVYSHALEGNVNYFLEGDSIKPVFRKLN
jgi:glutamate-1-semialdehyde 2,1-aminomutase